MKDDVDVSLPGPAHFDRFALVFVASQIVFQSVQSFDMRHEFPRPMPCGAYQSCQPHSEKYIGRPVLFSESLIRAYS